MFRSLLAIAAIHLVRSPLPSREIHETPLFLDTVLLGDPSSEADHALDASGSVVSHGESGVSCRRIGANGYLRFQLKCDPKEQNYMTVQFWGSEKGEGQLYLYRGQERIGGYQRDRPELDVVKGEPCFPGRFYLSTYMIPLDMTQDKETVTLTIGSTGRPTPYSHHRKEAEQTEYSRGIYSVSSGTEVFMGSLPFSTSEDRPDPVPLRSVPSPSEQVAHIHHQIDLAVERMLTWQYFGDEWDRLVAEGKAPASLTGAIVIHGHRNSDWTETEWRNQTVQRGGVHARCQMVTEIFARAFQAEGSRYHKNEQLLHRVVAALDFYRIAQGSDGGFVEIEDRRNQWIGGPNRKPGNGCLMGFGLMGPPAAFLVLQEEVLGNNLLEAAIDDDGSENTTRVPRRNAYADLFKGARDYLVSPRGRGHAPNQDMADITAAILCDQCLETVAPGRAWEDPVKQRFLDMACGLAEDIYGGRWISEKGLSMEPNGSSNGGYCGNYGAGMGNALLWLARITGERRIQEKALQAVHTLSMFRYPSLDTEGHPCLRIEGVITWRNNFTPGKVSYGGNPYAAVALKDAVSLRELQLGFAHGLYSKIDLDRYWAHQQSTTVNWLRNVYWLQKAAALPATSCRLPFETDQPDFAWTDEEAGAVVVKRGQDRLLMSLQWRHGYATRERSPANAVTNDIARIHFRTPSYLHIANIAMESPFGFGELYLCRYGPYHVVMNASPNQTYVLSSLPKMRRVQDLLSRKWIRHPHKKGLPPLTSMVLYKAE